MEVFGFSAPSSNLSSLLLPATNETYTGESHKCGDTDSRKSFLWSLVDPDKLRHSLEWSMVLIVAYLSIFVIGGAGNSLVISITIFKRSIRTVTSMFLINLAIADLLVIVFCVPATLLANLFIPWILGSFMCKGVAYVQGVAVCASSYSVAALSLDRCIAIYRPLARHKGISKHQAVVSIALIWISSMIITLPWLFVFEVTKSEEDGQAYCLEVWANENHGKIYFLLANLTLGYLLPLVAIGISNITIWRHVSNRKVPQATASVRKYHRKTRHTVMKTLSTMTSVFLISWLPLYALATHLKFSSINGMGEWEANFLSFFLPCAQWLGSLNSSMNPIFYAFINSKFRRGFQSLFCSDRINRMDFWISSFHRGRQNVIRRRNAIRRKRSFAVNRIEVKKGAIDKNDLLYARVDL